MAWTPHSRNRLSQVFWTESLIANGCYRQNKFIVKIHKMARICDITIMPVVTWFSKQYEYIITGIGFCVLNLLITFLALIYLCQA